MNYIFVKPTGRNILENKLVVPIQVWSLLAKAPLKVSSILLNTGSGLAPDVTNSFVNILCIQRLCKGLHCQFKVGNICRGNPS